MTQSLAILRFLARKHDLYADNDQSLIRQEMFEQQFIDFRKNFSTSLLAKHSNGGPEFKQAKIEFIKTLPDQLKPISKFLGERRWFTGDKLNYVDIFAYETFDLMRLFSPGTLEQFNNLSQFITRFENIPAIKTYRNSKDFASIPFFIPIYQFILD